MCGSGDCELPKCCEEHARLVHWCVITVAAWAVCLTMQPNEWANLQFKSLAHYGVLSIGYTLYYTDYNMTSGAQYLIACPTPDESH